MFEDLFKEAEDRRTKKAEELAARQREAEEKRQTFLREFKAQNEAVFSPMIGEAISQASAAGYTAAYAQRTGRESAPGIGLTLKPRKDSFKPFQCSFVIEADAQASHCNVILGFGGPVQDTVQTKKLGELDAASLRTMLRQWMRTALSLLD